MLKAFAGSPSALDASSTFRFALFLGAAAACKTPAIQQDLSSWMLSRMGELGNGTTVLDVVLKGVKSAVPSADAKKFVGGANNALGYLGALFTLIANTASVLSSTDVSRFSGVMSFAGNMAGLFSAVLTLAGSSLALPLGLVSLGFQFFGRLGEWFEQGESDNAVAAQLFEQMGIPRP